MRKWFAIASLALIMVGCGDGVTDFSSAVFNEPYPIGTCLSFHVPLTAPALAYWPDSFDRDANQSDVPPKGKYVFQVAVAIEDLTPVACH